MTEEASIAVENVPVEQSWQVLAMVAPLAVEYCPAKQEEQDALVGRAVPVEYVPAKQSWQVLARLAPLAVEYCPAEQEVQETLACRPVAV